MPPPTKRRYPQPTEHDQNLPLLDTIPGVAHRAMNVAPPHVIGNRQLKSSGVGWVIPNRPFRDKVAGVAWDGGT